MLHSQGDIYEILNAINPPNVKGGIKDGGSATIVEAGSARFAIVILDKSQAKTFLSKFSDADDFYFVAGADLFGQPRRRG